MNFVTHKVLGLSPADVAWEGRDTVYGERFTRFSRFSTKHGETGMSVIISQPTGNPIRPDTYSGYVNSSGRTLDNVPS